MSTAGLPRPPSRLPAAYFLFAHLCLIAAGLLIGLFPARFVGFFYHPQMMAAVHLVTLGWISSSILGALYMIAPMSWRTRLREGRLDLVALLAWGVGVSGVVSHFWIDSYGGILWSAPLLLLGFLVVGVRAVDGVRRAPVEVGVKLLIGLAFVNLLLAYSAGVLLALRRTYPLLPGDVLRQVSAHAHMAALGWATLTVFGAGYRLLPMLIPSRMPPPGRTLASAVVLEIGLLGLVSGLWTAARLPWLAGSVAVLVAGLLLFLLQLGWMLRHRVPRSRQLPTPDFGLAHVATALLYLGLSSVLGVALLLLPLDSAVRLRWLPVYGVALLLGFLSQMVVGVSHRLLPLYSWFASAGSGDPGGPLPTSPYAGLHNGWLGAAFALWNLSIPLLALGLYAEKARLLGLGAWLLAIAVSGNTLHSYVRLGLWSWLRRSS